MTQNGGLRAPSLLYADGRAIGAPPSDPRAMDSGRAPEGPDLTSLIQRIADGDRDALGELYDVTVSKVFALAQFILRNSADAEEVVCDVYTRVWQGAAQYRSERGTVMSWLMMICRSRSLDLSRRNRIRARWESLGAPRTDESSEGPEDILGVIQQGTAVHRALQKLNPVRRRLVSLAFFRGLSHVEIAEECQLPVGTVKSHIRRALATLHAELVKGEGDAASIP